MVPTEWLQRELWRPGHLPWYDLAVWAVYLTHFFAVWLVAAMLWRRSRDRFGRYAVVTIVLTLAAFLVYWRFPAQPPWLAADLGHTGPVDRIVPEVWDRLGVSSMESVYENGNLVNTVAAMPSLHAAYPFMLLLFFWPAGWAVRAGLGALHAGDGVRARLRRRALHRRHPRRVGARGPRVRRGRGRPAGGPRQTLPTRTSDLIARRSSIAA